MEYAVRHGLPPRPTIAQVSPSSSIRSMVARSVQGWLMLGQYPTGSSSSRIGLLDDGRHAGAAHGGALRLGGGLEVGLEGAHPLLEPGVARGEDSYGEQPGVARTSD